MTGHHVIGIDLASLAHGRSLSGRYCPVPMANILEFLRGVLTDPEAQRLLDADPEGFVTRSGFGDLSGEDVVEAIGVVRRSLPADVTAALAAFDDEDHLPPVRPALGERDLDAAIRQLRHAVALVGAPAVPMPAPASVPTTPEWPTTGTGPAHHEPAEAEPALVDAGRGARAAAKPRAHAERPARHQPIAAEADTKLAAPPPAAPEPASVLVEVQGVPSVEALGAAIAAAADDVRTVLSQYADEVRERLAAVLAQAEGDTAGLRAAAESDREAARQALADARAEADRILTAAAEGRADLDARRSELRDAEKELRQRLAGLDDVFRSVLKEE
jgi:hypothetical protein